MKDDSQVFDLSTWINTDTICCYEKTEGGTDVGCGRVVTIRGFILLMCNMF